MKHIVGIIFYFGVISFLYSDKVPVSDGNIDIGTFKIPIYTNVAEVEVEGDGYVSYRVLAENIKDIPKTIKAITKFYTGKKIFGRNIPRFSNFYKLYGFGTKEDVLGNNCNTKTYEGSFIQISDGSDDEGANVVVTIENRCFSLGK